MNEPEGKFTPDEAARANKRVTFVAECDGKKIIREVETKNSVIVMSHNNDGTGRFYSLSNQAFIANSAIRLIDYLRVNNPVLFAKTLIALTELNSDEEPERICPKCNNSEINEGDKFCKICGHPLVMFSN